MTIQPKTEVINLYHYIIKFDCSTAKGLENESYEKWAQEMIGMKEILGKFANITGEDIIGMRAPYLKPGRNAQYEVRMNSE